MHRFGLKTVFSKLFASVMLTLVLFAISMIALTYLVHDNSANTRWQVLARQIVNQIDPFVDELDNATTKNERLQARFMLAIIKKSFDIFDESWQAKMGLYDRNGRLLIQTDDSDLPKVLPKDPSWIFRMLPTLSDSDSRNRVQAMGDRGYTLLYEPRNPRKRSELSAVLNLFTGTLLLLGIMTLVLWWIARSMTWRLNQMSRQMVQLGEGDFSVRVPARGTDEIASLARGFNQAAQKIEQLINANNLLLAHASHELRTPITRIRLQIEMMEMLTQELKEDSQVKFNKRAQAIKRDLTGLNDLVESILLVSRLDAGHAVEKNERVDLYDLVHQECQHYPEARFYGKPIIVKGQPKLLIHLIRNLLNNAIIHGIPPIDIHLYGVMDKADACVPPSDLLTVNEEQSDVMIAKLDAPSESVVSNQSTVADVDAIADSPVSILTPTSDASTTSKKSTQGALTSKFTKLTPSERTPLSKPHLFKQPSKNLSSKDLSKNDQQIINVSFSNDSDGNKVDKTSLIEKTTKSSELGFSKRLRRIRSEKVQPEPLPNYAVLAVIDNGSGIPIDKRQEIFSPFVRLQQKKKGSGLGLSLVAQIIEAHDATISTDTYEGRTRFLVVIPTNSEELYL